MKKTITLSIIIVEYKSGEHLNTLLRTLPKRKDWEVIVVDNAQKNRGYGGGINEGVKRAKGSYYLFMNPDVFFDKQAISTLMQYLQKHPNIGIVGPKYINQEGKTEQCSTQHPTLLSAMIALSPFNTLFPRNAISQQYWMKDWDRESTRVVDVISGAVMMVRAQEWKKIGGCDERMFLYWEEFDLCARYKKILGLDSVYLAEAIAYHPREVSMKTTQRDVLHNHFVHSRRVYFKKHLGFLSMMCIEVWLWLCDMWRYVSVTLLALLLRTWDMWHIKLIGDVGRDYLEAFRMISFQYIPLMGIPSSIPRFLQGPFNVWFDAVSFFFGGTHPFSPVLFSAALTTVGVLLLMLLAETHYGKYAGLIAGLVAATLPAGVLQSRMPFYLFAVPLFLTWHLIQVSKLRPTQTSVFFAVITYWLTFQWEIAVLPLSMPLFTVLWKLRMSWKAKWASVGIATLIGLLPQIVYDITHACTQICGLGVWSIYRILALTGFDGKHGVTVRIWENFFSAISTQFSHLVGLGVWGSLGVVMFCIVACVVYMRHADNIVRYVALSSLILFFAIMIHGSPSEAYFPPYLVYIPFLCAFVVSRMSISLQKGMIGIALVYAGIISFTLIQHRFYADSIRSMLDAAQWIARDAQQGSVTLISYDAPAQQITYLDHMKFLVFVYGGKTSSNGQEYIVALDPSIGLPTLNVMTQTFGHIRVVKHLSPRSNLVE